MTIRLVVGLVLAACVPAMAQTKPAAQTKPRANTEPRWDVSISGGALTPTESLTDRFVYTLNAEQATTEARYPRQTGVLFDAGVGRRFWRNVGAAIHASRGSISGDARTDSQLPHPFFDDRDRQVSGEGGGLDRVETAAHVEIYHVRTFGSWRLRLGGGPSYFDLQQDVVTGVAVDEMFPYDTATFRNLVTTRVRDRSAGFNVAADVTWMFARRSTAKPRPGAQPRFGLGGFVRYARAPMELNADDGHRVSLDAGGVQAALGIRVTF